MSLKNVMHVGERRAGVIATNRVRKSYRYIHVFTFKMHSPQMLGRLSVRTTGIYNKTVCRPVYIMLPLYTAIVTVTVSRVGKNVTSRA